MIVELTNVRIVELKAVVARGEFVNS